MHNNKKIQYKFLKDILVMEIPKEYKKILAIYHNAVNKEVT